MLLLHMKRMVQYTEIVKKIAWLSTVAIVGASTAVYAQNTSSTALAIPPLPPIPSPGGSAVAPIPLPPSMANIPSATEKKPEEQVTKTAAPLPPPIPGGSDKIAGSVSVTAAQAPSIPAAATSSATPTAAPATTAATTAPPPPLGGLPPPPTADTAAKPADAKDTASKQVDAQSSAGKEDEDITPLPASFTERLKAAPTGIVLPPALKLPKVHEHAITRPRTWHAKLKPVVKPRSISFNYRRQLLPGTIYKPSYDAENRHLPTAVTGEDYDRWFLESVANNDINATRALLDRGRDANMVNAEGDTVLVMALRYGAYDTARLLLARGANPALAGPSGLSAYNLQPPPPAMR